MAGQRWEITHAATRGWCVVVPRAAPEIIATGLTKTHARQIVHEHNMHQKMLDACKLALTNLCAGCSKAPGPCKEGGRAPRMDRCCAAETANRLREVIAEAEKEGE